MPAAAGETVAIAVGKHDSHGVLDIRFVPPSEAVDAQPVADTLLAALVANDGEARSKRAYRKLIEGANSVKDAAMNLLIEAGQVEMAREGTSNRYTVTGDGYAALNMDAPYEQGDLM